MSISDLFRRLEAPLANQRWSWGAVRESDGTVFLRVWQDRKIVENRQAYFMITHHARYEQDPDNIGHQERLRHVDLIRDGAKCYLVMCRAKDVSARPRKIESFNSDDLFLGGQLREHEGETWIEKARRVPVKDLAK